MYRSISTVKADLAQTEFGITGQGIVWAVVSTGVDARHPHFERFRNLELPDQLYHMDYSTIGSSFHRRGEGRASVELLHERFRVSRLEDPHGIGTAVAGLIAGESHDAEGGQTLRGLAPQATIVSFNVFDRQKKGSEINVVVALQAIQHINDRGGGLVIHGVVLPLSIPWDAANYLCGHSPVCIEVDRLSNSGVIVVVQAGNTSFDTARGAVVEGGITDPGNAQLAITAGASHRISPQIYGASFFSSRGPTADGRRKPDLLAPGERIQVCAPLRDDRNAGEPEAGSQAGGIRPEYTISDGTGLAAAHVAGAAALLLAARTELIGEPEKVKDILLRTAVNLGREPTYQGAGLLDVQAAARNAAGNSQPGVMQPLKVFCSYAREDRALWREFQAHLAPLARAGRIEVWSDELLEVGRRWEDQIFRQLDSADIVILLVSSYFMGSEFCYSKELKRALERDQEGTVRLVPVRVRPVSLLETVFADIQILPPGAKPITRYRDPHQGWTEVAEQFYEIVESVTRMKRSSGDPQAPPPR